jgi:hypothetical protein
MKKNKTTLFLLFLIVVQGFFHHGMEDSNGNGKKRTHSQMEATNGHQQEDFGNSTVESQYKLLKTDNDSVVTTTIIDPLVPETLNIEAIKKVTLDTLNKDAIILTNKRYLHGAKLINDFIKKFSADDKLSKYVCNGIISQRQFSNFFHRDPAVDYSSPKKFIFDLNLLFHRISREQNSYIINKLGPDEDFFQLTPVGENFNIIDPFQRTQTYSVEDGFFRIFLGPSSMEKWNSDVQKSLLLLFNYFSCKHGSLAVQLPPHQLHYTMYPMANNNQNIIPNNQYGLIKLLIDNMDFFKRFFINRCAIDFKFKLDGVFQSFNKAMEQFLKHNYPNIFFNSRQTSQQQNFKELREAFGHFQLRMSKFLMEMFVKNISVYSGNFNQIFNGKKNEHIFSTFDILTLMGCNFHQLKYINKWINNKTIVYFGAENKNIKNLVEYMDNLFNVTFSNIPNLDSLSLQFQPLQRKTLLLSLYKSLLSVLLQEYIKTNVQNSDLILRTNNDKSNHYPQNFNEKNNNKFLYELATSIPIVIEQKAQFTVNGQWQEVIRLIQNIKKGRAQYCNLKEQLNQIKVKTNAYGDPKKIFLNSKSIMLDILSYVYPMDTKELFTLSNIVD